MADLNSSNIKVIISSGEEIKVTVDNYVSPDTVSVTNSESSAITKGQPVYISGSGQVSLANATAANSAKVIGLVASDSIAASTSGTIQLNGVINSSDWTAITGSTTLTAGAVYFLDTVAGKLTPIAPTSGYVVEVGVAISNTDLNIV